MTGNRYILISPVRNEQDYIVRTVESVVSQTRLPHKWVIVDDGSTDQTAEIVRNFQATYPWIHLVSLTDRGYYFPGTGVVTVFNAGLETIRNEEWDYVVKLDVDLSFEPDYFEELLKRFEADPKLGIASGITYLPAEGASWKMEAVLDDHPVGPSKMYRRTCFEAIGGLLPVPGWDLADLLAAQMKGWQTRCWKDLMIKHYRPTGTRRQGRWARGVLQGRFEYRHGYAPLYTLVKAVYNLIGGANPVWTAGKIAGYTLAVFKQDPFIFDAPMRSFLRQKQHEHLKQQLFRNTHPT
ncbi:glycosyltransferase [Sphaerotilus microaerophilus]|uniref:Glycosyl transferase family A n=1 Tax=Sphaerotilus microaerophilus TaxID=2914710 RepID=A0ABM7YKJ9_9BURK|nr:glycosyltransferase family A protein [Sphaerotilus sp. FB-5]BDI04940.1 glycosyl transferase family A [Sphaerotilus sp. FB-5]